MNDSDRAINYLLPGNIQIEYSARKKLGVCPDPESDRCSFWEVNKQVLESFHGHAPKVKCDGSIWFGLLAYHFPFAFNNSI